MTWNYDYSTVGRCEGLPTGALLDVYDAMRERYKTISENWDTPGRDNPLVNAPKYTQAKIGGFVSLHELFTSLVNTGRWVNHVSNGGVYDNQVNIPIWTIDDLETEIGEPRPADPESLGGRYTPLWIWWHYKAINLLLWTQHRRVGIASNAYELEAITTVEYFNTTFLNGYASWAAIVAAWPDTFSSLGGVPAGYGSSESASNFDAFRTMPYYLVRAWTTDYKPNADLYWFTNMGVDVASPPFSGATYNNEGLNLYQDAFGKVMSVTGVTLQDSVLGDYFAMDSRNVNGLQGIPPPQPNVDEIHGWGSFTEISPVDPPYLQVAVVKWNTAEGFTFV